MPSLPPFGPPAAAAVPSLPPLTPTNLAALPRLLAALLGRDRVPDAETLRRSLRYYSSEAVREAERLGAAGFLTKPYDLAALVVRFAIRS